MQKDIAIVAPGAMGSAIARRLAENGARVPTLLDGRSAATRSRAGAATALRDELAASQPRLPKRFTTTLPDMFPKAHRRVAEMREIATFAGEDAAAAGIFTAAAEFYERIAADWQGDGHETALIRDFLAGDATPPTRYTEPRGVRRKLRRSGRRSPTSSMNAPAPDRRPASRR